MKKLILFLTLILSVSISFSQDEVIWLWKGVEKMKGEKTRLYVFQAPDSINTGVSVIICPGGSYHHLGLRGEGFTSARWFNSMGITAFVLRYRVSIDGYHHPAMIQDVQRAIQWTRDHAEKYAIDPHKIGVMGFSAGGHLSLMAGAFYNQDYLSECVKFTRINLKPAFVAPIYPVVSMQDSIAHEWSRESLLTKHYTKELQDQFSMELQIPDAMPPVFLLASKDDPVVDYRNSVALHKALEDKHIKNKFLLYETGGHGYGMKDTEFTRTTRWNYLLYEWLKEIGVIIPKR